MISKNLNEKDVKKDSPDETTPVMIFGNLKIIDKDTGKILVNKRF